MELDLAKMQQMLQFWQSHQDTQPELTLLELIQKTATANEELEVETDDTLAREAWVKLRSNRAII